MNLAEKVKSLLKNILCFNHQFINCNILQYGFNSLKESMSKL